MAARFARPLALLAMLVLAMGGDVVLAPAAQAQTNFSAAQRAELQQMVHDYILENPDVVMEALTRLQARQEQAEEQQQRQQVASSAAQLFRSTDSPIMGNPNGDVTLVEFFDYQCGYCKRVLETVFQLTSSDPNLRVVFKEFPILGPASVVAARAALASREQGRYVEYHNALMAYRGALTEDSIFAVAGQIGLDVDRLRRDMESPAVSREINANMELARTLGIRGTPAFVIGDRVIPGAVSIDVLRQLVAEQRPG